MSELNEYRLLVSDYYDAVGEARNKAEMDHHANALRTSGFVKCEDGEYRSASGETATQFLSNALVYGSRANRPTSQTPKPDRYHGFTQAEWEALSVESRIQIDDVANGPAVPSWKKAVPVVTDQQCAAHAGLSLADFKALPVERRLEIEAVTKFALTKARGNG